MMCDWPKCDKLATSIYLNKGLCDYHWEFHVGSAETKVMYKSFQVLGITELYNTKVEYENEKIPRAIVTGQNDGQGFDK